MKLNKISLKVAVITPFIAMVLIIVAVFAFLWNSDYNQLADKQSERVVQSISNVTQDRLKALMQEPLRLTKLSAEQVSMGKLYMDKDMASIADHEYSVFKTLNKSLPQIAVIAYADEEGRYVGIRANKQDGSYSLMLQDARTDGKLTIYDKASTDSNVIAAYEGYDPRTRPWYMQAKNSLESNWSEVYVNYDEKMEATVSTLVRIYGENHQFKGIMCYDVTLTGVSDFLKKQRKKGSGVVYIIDKDWNLIASSGDEKVMKINAGDPPTGELMSSKDSENSLIKASTEYLTKQSDLPDHPVPIKIKKEHYYLYESNMAEPQGLDWRVVILIPETDLMGTIRDKQNIRTIIGILIALIGSTIGYLFLNNIIESITRSTKAASDLAEGFWETKIEANTYEVKETKELTTAFNKMTEKLKSSFDQIKYSEEKYKTLVEETIVTLGEIAEKHFDDTGTHVKRVSYMMHHFGLVMKFSEEECEKLRLASILHDVGKIGIPDAVLKKPGKLTEEEFEIIKGHSELGYKILSGSNLDILQTAAEIAHSHHEKYDGSGYPKGTKGEDIPIQSRMLAIIDVFDAMSHKRVYKEASTFQETLDYIVSQKGKHFDAQLVEVFVRNINRIISGIDCGIE
jgi:HD-GYP domain-containing protein (c-di-GMP phosphodiesterase class II)